MRYIFWDWNGTLINDADALCQAFNQLISQRGVEPVSLERYRDIYRHPIKNMYRDVGVDLDAHPFEAMADLWHQLYRDAATESALHHDALSTILALTERGSSHSVVSALPHHFLIPQVERFGVRHLFDNVHGIPDAFAESKVAQAVQLAERLEARGRDITVVGDSSHDAEVARELNANCVLVARGAESRARLERNGYPVVDDFSFLMAIERG
jgi:phosphoglycolate phosphatase